MPNAENTQLITRELSQGQEWSTIIDKIEN